MPIPLETQRWLSESGFRNHAFISWPHSPSRYMKKFAARLKDGLLERLFEQVAGPQIFLDLDSIPPGAEWDPVLKEELCRSVVMVAVCAPIYFHPDHAWCGLEWAAMSDLSDRRLGGPKYRAIVPVIVSDVGNLPDDFKKDQYIDVSTERVRASNFLRSQGFRELVDRIVAHIETVAVELHRRDAWSECDTYEFPTRPAFRNHEVAADRRLPLTG